MAEKFARFDAADYLHGEAEITAYLDAAAADGDPALLVSALGTVARARNISQLARDTGLTREGISKALSPNGNPAFATVVKVAHALGMRVKFEPISAG
jgi:probable addiction module antidote protein